MSTTATFIDKMNLKLNWFYYRLIRKKNGIQIASSENTKETKSYYESKNKNARNSSGKKNDRIDDPAKFKIYFNFTTYMGNIQSHQTLAINRGEAFKVSFNSISINSKDFHLNHLYYST